MLPPGAAPQYRRHKGTVHILIDITCPASLHLCCFLRKAETQNTKSAVSLLNRSSSWRGLEGEAVERKIQSTTALLLLRPRPYEWPMADAPASPGRASAPTPAGLTLEAGGGRRHRRENQPHAASLSPDASPFLGTS